jgi:hypothetical protein
MNYAFERCNRATMTGTITKHALPSSLRRRYMKSHCPAAMMGGFSRCLALFAIATFFLTSQSKAAPMFQSGLMSHWGQQRHCHKPFSKRILSFRGGSSVEEEEEDKYDDEGYDSEEVEEGVALVEEEEEEEEDEEDDTSQGVQIEVKVEKFDEPLVAPPMINLFASLGVMLLGRRVDLFSKPVVVVARVAFIAYLILHQLFVLYVRIQAKILNDRTPIELSNPLSSVIQSQLGQGGSNGMMKNIASSFLSSKSTVMEYDLKQSRSMQGGLIFNMLLMWFLHFKMGQVQPLLIQSVTGMSNLVFSPLFQVYGLGRNLERPFKNPAATAVEEGVEEEVHTDTSETDKTEKEGELEIEESDTDNEKEDVADEDTTEALKATASDEGDTSANIIGNDDEDDEEDAEVEGDGEGDES